MLFNNGAFGGIIRILTHNIFNSDEGGQNIPPLLGNEMLIEDGFDMLTEDNVYMALEDS